MDRWLGSSSSAVSPAYSGGGGSGRGRGRGRGAGGGGGGKPSARRLHIPTSALPPLQYYGHPGALLPRGSTDAAAVPLSAPRAQNAYERAHFPHDRPAPPSSTRIVTDDAVAVTQGDGECVVTAVHRLPQLLDAIGQSRPEVYDGCCWWCRHPLPAGVLPVGVPVAHDPTRNTYHLFGMMCSWNCAAAYAGDSMELAVQQRARMLILQLLRTFARAATRKGQPLDVNTVACHAAPHWSHLRAYGGTMTIDEFRATHATRQLRVYPEWTRLVPVGFLVYEEDAARPVSRMFTGTYQRVDPLTGRPMPPRRSFAPPAAVKRESPAAVAGAPSGLPKAPWEWKTLQARQEAVMQADELKQQQQGPQSRSQLHFHANPLTGRREQAPQPTAADVAASAQRLKLGTRTTAKCASGISTTTASAAPSSHASTHVSQASATAACPDGNSSAANNQTYNTTIQGAPKAFTIPAI